jgi:hypothetical protein
VAPAGVHGRGVPLAGEVQTRAQELPASAHRRSIKTAFVITTAVAPSR